MPKNGLVTKVPAILFILVVAFASCKRSSETASQTNSATSESSQFQHAQGGSSPQAQARFFKGTIGDNLALQMKLFREGERLSGSYAYQKVGTKIDLRGTIDNDGNLVLGEFDANGKQTGEFRGTWKTEDDGLIALAGNWKAPNSAKQTAFSLREEPIEFSGGVEITAKRITEKNKKLRYELDAEYPQLSGSGSPNYEKFNQMVRSLITGKVNDFRKGMASEASEEPPPDTSDMGNDLNITYVVVMAKDDLISLDFSVSSYSAGAAHPNSYSETVNYDLRNGKSLKLADLFNPGAKYVQALSSYSIQDLKKQGKGQGADSMLDDDWIERGAGPDPENYHSWTISKKGLVITFDSYQVAAYAAGPQHVLVPYSALKDIIRADGPIGQFLE